MWKQLLEFGKEILGIRQRLQQQEEASKQLALEVRRLNERLDGLASRMERIAFELEGDREHAAKDRENLLLRLENALLRFERRLPRGGPPDEPPALE
jgi:hypothetical protein